MNVTTWAAYLYRVVAVSADNSAAESAPSNADVAMRTAYTDPGALGGLVVRGAHLTDLRRAVDGMRVVAGLPRAWSQADYVPAVGELIRGSHFDDVRSALAQARAALASRNGIPQPGLGTRTAIVSAPFIETLRGALQ